MYEQKIVASGGIDIQLLGIGRNGHIGFNEPSSSIASRTRVKTLPVFSDHEFQAHLAITMGIGTILESKKVVLLATGHHKAQAISDTVQGSIRAESPASALQFHANEIIIIDETSASKLKSFINTLNKKIRS